MRLFYKVRFAACATLICSLLFGLVESSGQPKVMMRGMHQNLQMHVPHLVPDHLIQGTRSSIFLTQSQLGYQPFGLTSELAVEYFVQRFNDVPEKRDYFLGMTRSNRFGEGLATFFGMEEQSTSKKPSVVHVINAGETISEIVKEHYGHVDNALVNKIARYNNILDPNNIRVGQRIFLPDDILTYTPVFREDVEKALYRSKFYSVGRRQDIRRLELGEIAADIFAESDNAKVLIFKRRPTDDDDLLVFDDNGESSSINSREELDQVLGKRANIFPELPPSKVKESTQKSEKGTAIIESGKAAVTPSNEMLKRLGLNVIGHEGADNPIVITPSTDVILVNRYLEEGLPEIEVWHHLSDDTRILGFERLPNTKNVILEKADNDYTMHLVDRETGLSVSKLSSLTEFYDFIRNSIVKPASTDGLPFFHAASEGEDVVIQLGENMVRIPRQDIAQLLDNPEIPNSTLDALFASSVSPRETGIYRDPLCRRPPSSSAEPLKMASETDPLRLTAMLNVRYPNKTFYLCNDVVLAKENIAAIRPIRSANELAMVVPDSRVGLTDYGVVKNIKRQLSKCGVTMIPIDQQGEKVNGRIVGIILISFHMNQKLKELLEDLGKLGLLRNRVLFAETCYLESNIEFFSGLIKTHGLRMAIEHTAKIGPVEAQEFYNQMPFILPEIEKSGSAKDPVMLWREMGVRALKNPNLSPTLRSRLEEFMKTFLPQTSDLQFETPRNSPRKILLYG